jgi:hypothetical protein
MALGFRHAWTFRAKSFLARQRISQGSLKLRLGILRASLIRLPFSRGMQVPLEFPDARFSMPIPPHVSPMISILASKRRQLCAPTESRGYSQRFEIGLALRYVARRIIARIIPRVSNQSALFRADYAQRGKCNAIMPPTAARKCFRRTEIHCSCVRAL